ncbi:hypothetical protein PUN28_015641 [Cardiocondyla obscurior]|uniref:Uncharacterized protein n=1 Tax=Cardiocondyla obscurior TaxID=286306 RepID=A0AAW2EVT6_9HYME
MCIVPRRYHRHPEYNANNNLSPSVFKTGVATPWRDFLPYDNWKKLATCDSPVTKGEDTCLRWGLRQVDSRGVSRYRGEKKRYLEGTFSSCGYSCVGILATSAARPNLNGHREVAEGWRWHVCNE